MEEQESAKVDPAPSIGRRMARGAAWMVALRSADRVLGFASMLVLARLLVPADFGLIALGMAVVASLSAFSEFGLDLALIQNQTAERKHYDTAWTLNGLRGILLGGLLLLLANPYADLMGDQRLVELIYVLALVPFLEGINNIGIVEFRKELLFRKEFLFRFSSRLGGVLTTLTLAFFWRDFWALVIGQLTASGLRLLLSYQLHSYRPRFSLEAWRDLFNFSKWLFLNGLARFASKRAATFVVGAFLTPASVGLFSLSEEIIGLVSQALVAPIKRTLFPGFSKLSDDIKAVREVLLKAYALTVLISLPLSAGIGLTADLFVPLAFGAKWLETIPVIQILVLAALAASLHGPIRPLLLALNRPDLVTFLSILNAAVLIPALIVGTWSAGLLGAAWALVGEGFAMLAVQYYILWRFLRISVTDVMYGIWRALVSCGLMALAVWWLKGTFTSSTIPGIAELLLNMALAAGVGALIYCASLLCLWGLSRSPADSAEGIVVAQFKNRLIRARKQQDNELTNGE